MPIGPTGTFPRGDLRGHLMERTNRQALLVALSVLPALPVNELASSLATIPAWSNSQIPDMTRAPGGHYPRIQWGVEEVTYRCKDFGLEVPIDDTHRARYRNFFDADAACAEIAQDTIDIRLERAVATACYNTTTFTGAANTSAVSVEWNTYATATPASDLVIATETVRQKTGIPAIGQTVLMSEKVARNVTLCADYRVRMKIDSSPISARWDAAMLAAYFGVKEVIVGCSAYNSANIAQTESFTDVWDDEYVLVFVKSSDSPIMGPGLGRCIAYEADGGLLTVTNYREPRARSDVVQVYQHVDVKVFGANFGYLLSNITT